ncbi:MAG: DUF5343 domain-containing protein [Candidatus Thorarchaeota archaeon]
MTEVYPYTVSSRFENFLATFHERGIPDKFTNATLEEAGYKSKNDRKIKDVLKFIGFIDDKNVPTKRYNEFRNRSKQKKVMAEALTDAYAGLFKSIPQAHTKDRKILEDFFSTKTKSGKQVYAAMARTFEILCKFADFGVALMQPKAQQAAPSITVPTQSPAIKSGPLQPQININIQFVLPKDKDPEVYDSIFASLKKHFLAWESNEEA